MKAKTLFWVILGLALLASAWLRIGVPHDDLMGDKVRFPSVDAYYHLIAADYTYDNWPDVETFNSNMIWPEGQNVGQRPLNSWLMATIAQVGNSPIDVVGAYWPAILGVLVLIPVLIIGWLLWGKWAALIGVVLLATIQGEFLGRTSLGFCDHHALEVFLSTIAVLFFMLALKRHWYWSFGAGVFLGLHMLNWAGAPLLSLVFLVYTVIQSVYNQWSSQPNWDLCLSSFIVLSMSCAIFAVFRNYEMTYMLFLITASFAPIVLYATSRWMSRLKAYWYPIFLVIGGAVGIGVLCLLFPTTTKYALWELQGLVGVVGSTQSSLGRTISEMQPLFVPYGNFTMSLVWGCYGLVFIVGILGFFGLKLKRPEVMLVFIWSLGMLLVTLMQRRFGYYLAVNLCLLAGYFWWLVIVKFGWRRKEKSNERYFNSYIITAISLVIVVTMIIPNSFLSIKGNKYHTYAITPAWIEATEWLKNEPSGGVISWWDYGYWIVRESEKPVPCHPGGGSTADVAMFFTSQSTEEANLIAYKLQSRYVVIDYQMVEHKFYAMPLLAGRDNFTQLDYLSSMICRLYFSSDGIKGYQEVFESEQTYKGHGQVKIYEIGTKQ